MRAFRTSLPLLLIALVASCGGSGPYKPSSNRGQTFTGVTEYYRPGSRPPSVSPSVAPLAHQRTKASGGPRRLTSPKLERPSPPLPSGASSSYTGPPVFSNPDGTTSKVIGNTLIRSDGSVGDMIGNTAYHPDGTTSKIVGDTLYNPDGTTSRRITTGAP